MNRNLITSLILSALAGCAHMDSPGEVTYGTTAAQDYELGQAALKDSRYQEATKYFEHVRNKYPYSTQASLADLAVADTNFEREKYVEAIEGYRSFIKLHPHHPQSDYAQFRIALSYYKDIPSDFFLFPPAIEKDQTAVRDSRTALEDFLKLCPTSSLVPEAKKLLADVRNRLAEHEMVVANFYLAHDHWLAAAGRLNKLVDDFPGTELEPDALIKLARAYIALKQPEKARPPLERLLKDYPNDRHRGEAEKLLKGLA